MRAVRESLRQSSVLFVSNHTTLNELPEDVRAKSIIVPPNALRPEDEQWTSQDRVVSRENRPFRLLYVGNCVATRAIPIVFEALMLARLNRLEFNIVGAGPSLASWKKLPSRYQIADQVIFRGKVPFKNLASFYATADVLVFPALRDSGGSALLEAMARYVPIICLDWAGPGEMIDADSGIKIPVSNPVQTISDFAHGILRLERDPELRRRLALAARRRAETLFRWESKRQLLVETYRKLIKG
jgi:glycosyltransferase involved in cell wall biosynthesis